MTLQVKWQGDTGWLAWFTNLARTVPETAGVAGVGGAAVRVQAAMRRNLQAMIYSQPKAASGYERTHTLERSTHAAPPDVDHSGDEDAAHGGADLASERPEQVAGVRGSQVISEIGSWISYAPLVAEGVNQPEPRDFAGATEDEAREILAEEMSKALGKALGGS